MGKNNEAPTTLNELIEGSVARHERRAAVGMAFKNPISYREFHRRLLAVAAYLKEWGVEKGDRVAILGENSPQWGIVYFAIVRLGGVAVPILPDFPEADVHHILADTEAKLLFVSQRQMEKIEEFEGRHLLSVFGLDDFSGQEGGWLVQPYNVLLGRGRRLPVAADQGEGWRETVARAEDLAAIIYTSGTSCYSKGVMLSHANLLANLASVQGVIAVEPGWTFLSLLPMAHAYEFTIGFLLPLAKGARIVYAGKMPAPAVLAQICREEKPRVICMVPMILEKIHKKRVLPVIQGSRLGQRLARAAFFRRFFYRRIGGKLRDFFGGRLVLAAIGGAPLNPEVENFLAEANFPYLVGYGLTECSPLLSGGPFRARSIALGSAGKPVAGVEIRIADPDPVTGVGEICARGGNVMRGYYNNPAATAETISADGWLRTGDLGYLDGENNLFIRGRIKNVIIFANGENIYPEAIEAKIVADRHVLEALVGEQEGRLLARVYFDHELLGRESAGLSQSGKEEYVRKLCVRIKEEVNAKLPPSAKLAFLVAQPEPFVKTATQKIKRYLYQPAVPSD